MLYHLTTTIQKFILTLLALRLIIVLHGGKRKNEAYFANGFSPPSDWNELSIAGLYGGYERQIA